MLHHFKFLIHSFWRQLCHGSEVGEAIRSKLNIQVLLFFKVLSQTSISSSKPKRIYLDQISFLQSSRRNDFKIKKRKLLLTLLHKLNNPILVLDHSLGTRQNFILNLLMNCYNLRFACQRRGISLTSSSCAL